MRRIRRGAGRRGCLIIGDWDGWGGVEWGVGWSGQGQGQGRSQGQEHGVGNHDVGAVKAWSGHRMCLLDFLRLRTLRSTFMVLSWVCAQTRAELSRLLMRGPCSGLSSRCEVHYSRPEENMRHTLMTIYVQSASSHLFLREDLSVNVCKAGTSPQPPLETSVLMGAVGGRSGSISEGSCLIERMDCS